MQIRNQHIELHRNRRVNFDFIDFFVFRLTLLATWAWARLWQKSWTVIGGLPWTDVVKHTRSCCKGQFLKPKGGKASGHLQPLDPPSGPFEIMHINHAGPLIKSKRGNRHIIVAIDQLTRWVEIRAVPDTSASLTLAFLLQQVFLRHGTPRVIISDRGSAFTGKAMEEFLERWGVQHRMTAPAHPQRNGLLERMNKTLAPVLASYVNAVHTDWDEYIPSAAFAVNTAKQETTKYSPFDLVNGRTARLPGEWNIPWPTEWPVAFWSWLLRWFHRVAPIVRD